jgi:hypothetical protein
MDRPDVQRLIEPDFARLVQVEKGQAPVAVLAREAVGLSPDSACDLATALVARVYALEAGDAPTPAQLRYALLRKLMAALLPGSPRDAVRAPKNFRMDEISRDLYLAFAGVRKGPLPQADRAIVRHILGVSGSRYNLAAEIVRLASGERPARTEPQPHSEFRPDAEQAAPRALNGAAAPVPAPDAHGAADAGLANFAESVRGLARTLETRPYKGRVAIAQVYDAGMAQGLALGSIEDFKARLAEAARESLLDLERYDIAGPIDPALKERSRTRFGRDERHFIVNEWI